MKHILKLFIFCELFCLSFCLLLFFYNNKRPFFYIDFMASNGLGVPMCLSAIIHSFMPWHKGSVFFQYIPYSRETSLKALWFLNMVNLFSQFLRVYLFEVFILFYFLVLRGLDSRYSKCGLFLGFYAILEIHRRCSVDILTMGIKLLSVLLELKLIITGRVMGYYT